MEVTILAAYNCRMAVQGASVWMCSGESRGEDASSVDTSGTTYSSSSDEQCDMSSGDSSENNEPHPHKTAYPIANISLNKDCFSVPHGECCLLHSIAHSMSIQRYAGVLHREKDFWTFSRWTPEEEEGPSQAPAPLLILPCPPPAHPTNARHRKMRHRTPVCATQQATSIY